MRTSGEGLPAAAESSERTPKAHGTVSACHDLAPLIPTSPPGRVTRKARHYVAQILLLREQGYTLETIQQALANVGVKVSVSTVRREALRPMPKPLSPAPNAVAAPPAVHDAAGPSPPTPPPSASPPTKPASPIDGLPSASAKDLAEAYVLGRSKNPLVRAREQSS